MPDPQTPERILAEISLQFLATPQLWILSGASGAGKTTACRRLVFQARRLGAPIAGVLSLPVYQYEKKVAIDLHDLAAGETRRLAWKRESQPAASAAEPVTPGWRFDPAVLAWGNRVLEAAPAGAALVIDELGLLEFQQGAGLVAGLARLDEQRHQAAFAVVRSSLLPIALDRWPWARLIEDPTRAFAEDGA